MDALYLQAVGRAEQDFRDGLSQDENPFPPGSPEARLWDAEMDRLFIQEAKRELSAA